MPVAADVSPGKPAIVFTVIVGTEAHIRIYGTPSPSFVRDQWRWLWWHYFRWWRIFSLTQWAFRSLCGEGKWTTLVFAFTLCYTGLRTKSSDPRAQVMTKIGEPRQNQKTNSYQQKQMTIHDIPFSCSSKGLSNREYIIRIQTSSLYLSAVPRYSIKRR